MFYTDSRLEPPEDKEISTAYKCSICNKHVNVGEEFISIDGDCFHKDCFEELTTEEIAKLLGGLLKVATIDDVDDYSDELYDMRKDEALLNARYIY